MKARVSTEELIGHMQVLDAAIKADCPCPGDTHTKGCPRRSALMQFGIRVFDPALIGRLMYDLADERMQLSDALAEVARLRAAKEA